MLRPGPLRPVTEFGRRRRGGTGHERNCAGFVPQFLRYSAFLCAHLHFGLAQSPYKTLGNLRFSRRGQVAEWLKALPDIDKAYAPKVESFGRVAGSRTAISIRRWHRNPWPCWANAPRELIALRLHIQVDDKRLLSV